MKILWIYNMPLRPEAGGTERITSLVAKGLSMQGHECMDILVFNQDGKITYHDETVDNVYQFLIENNVDIVINQIAYSKWLLADFLAKGGDRWHKEGGKIISCLHFDPCNPSYIQLLRSKEKLSLRNWLQIIKHALLSHYYRHKKEFDEGIIYNYIYDNSDALVILSQRHLPYMRKVMKRQNYGKITAINNPLTFPNIATTEDLDKKRKTILVCARMSEYHKRISLVLKAWKILQHQGVTQDWILKLVGDGPDLNRYKKLVEKNCLDNVVFYGQQNPLPFYQEASILLLTSSAEGWGLTITEGLQNGVVPVVMNSSPVYTEIIENNCNGFLTANNNIASLAEYCRILMTDSRRLHRMQINAMVSSKKFDIKKTLNLWEQIL